MATILFIDDDDVMRQIVQRTLARKGYEFVSATNGLEGILLAKASRPDLILMDMRLPVLDGWSATRQLKADPDTAHIPVIALTAHGLASDRRRCLEVGCDDYEPKPVDFNRLLGKIEACLLIRNGVS